MISIILLPFGAILIPALSLFINRKGVFAFFAILLLAAAFVFNFLSPVFLSGCLSAIFSFDELSRFFNAIFILVAWITAVFAFGLRPEREVVFYSMLLAGTAAMAVVASSRSILGIFIGLELLSLCFYELCALKKDGLGMESAMKLFFTSIFSSVLFAIGAVLVYTESNSFDLSQFLRFAPSALSMTGLGFLLAGIAFKMSLFPFNFWLPDVYQGAPSEVTALLAGSAKKAGFVAYLRLIIGASSFKAGAVVAPYAFISFPGIVAMLSFLTMSFGNVIAIVQKNVKRMIAYSIIAHAGFLAMGLAAATPLGYLGLLFHILIHALMAAGTFLTLEILEKVGIKELEDYDGLGKRAPLISVILTIFLLSLTGIPPLAGFLSKFLLWSSVMEVGFWWLGVAAIINSAISTYFYFLILRRTWGINSKNDKEFPVIPWNQKFALTIPAALVVILGLYPNPALLFIQKIITGAL